MCAPFNSPEIEDSCQPEATEDDASRVGETVRLRVVFCLTVDQKFL